MKISRTYEVWTGGDMVEDFIDNRDYAIKLAIKELNENEGVEVVVDEIVHYKLDNIKDIEELEKEI
jgi:hypothetical protein